MSQIDLPSQETRVRDDYHYEWVLAHKLLEKSGLGVLDSVRLILDLLDASGGIPDVKRMKRCISLGATVLEREELTVTFREAINNTLISKSYRRPRTLSDIRQLMDRLMKANQGLSRKRLRSISSEDCNQYLKKAFLTSRQFFKARLILSGVFTLAKRRGWCDNNPVEGVDVPVLTETEIPALDIDTIKDLLYFARRELKGECLPAVLLMLFAGIRPREVQRLKWGDICLNEKVVSLKPSHTKTGGARHVTIHPVLSKWLQYSITHISPDEEDSICPPNWLKKWTKLRKIAGWSAYGDKGEWKQDCLRHTFASYHAKYFQDYASLQIEMGHHSSALLRTRYLNMSGITRSDAKAFWNLPIR